MELFSASNTGGLCGKRQGEEIPLKIGGNHAFAAHVEKKIIKGQLSTKAIITERRWNGKPFQTDISTGTRYSHIDRGVFRESGAAATAELIPPLTVYRRHIQ